MTDTEARRAAILKLVGEQRIRTQSELAKRLKKEGFAATQTTLSRDIAALKLAKAAGGYAAPNLGFPPGLAQKLEGKITRVVRGGPYLVVVHTNAGEASAVALTLDHEAWPMVAGTVAGDDTLFVACDQAKDTNEVLRRLKSVAPDKFE
ncbi:MAG: hypothetical protein C4523_15085 [Myxococcales bacterium]|nr:MAG: hypothetical protein C4523_15085 [Myxococcales bacterium]